MLLFLTIAKALAEVALLALVGRWLLGLLAGARRDTNMFYQLLDIMARPFIKLARLITPKFILERHVPMVAFLLLAFTWVVVTISRVSHCLEIGIEQCR